MLDACSVIPDARRCGVMCVVCCMLRFMLRCVLRFRVAFRVACCVGVVLRWRIAYACVMRVVVFVLRIAMRIGDA